jgi:hypothetical protein
MMCEVCRTEGGKMKGAMKKEERRDILESKVN